MPPSFLPEGKHQSPLFGKDDCMDAGGRAMHGAVAEGLGEILLDNSR